MQVRIREGCAFTLRYRHHPSLTNISTLKSIFQSTRAATLQQPTPEEFTYVVCNYLHIGESRVFKGTLSCRDSWCNKTKYT